MGVGRKYGQLQECVERQGAKFTPCTYLEEETEVTSTSSTCTTYLRPTSTLAFELLAQTWQPTVSSFFRREKAF